jgi:hypothetical protein
MNRSAIVAGRCNRHVVRGLLAAAALLATATAALAQGTETPSADPRTRCEELVAFWLRHGGNKSEGGSSGDIARKNAEIDCGAGRYQSGIRAMEDLLRRNGYTVPPVGGN